MNGFVIMTSTQFECFRQPTDCWLQCLLFFWANNWWEIEEWMGRGKPISNFRPALFTRTPQSNEFELSRANWDPELDSKERRKISKTIKPKIICIHLFRFPNGIFSLSRSLRAIFSKTIWCPVWAQTKSLSLNSKTYRAASRLVKSTSPDIFSWFLLSTNIYAIAGQYVWPGSRQHGMWFPNCT